MAVPSSTPSTLAPARANGGGGCAFSLRLAMSGWRLKIHRKRAPKGLELVEDALDAFDEKMKEAVEASHEGMRRNETVWPVIKYHWLRNRYLYESYYKKKRISRELYEFLLRNKVGDGALIAKWKKRGYEYLCSLMAIDKSSSNFGTTSICRVPLSKRSREQQVLPAVNTGCVSCASCDKGAPIWWDGPFKRSDLLFSDEEEEDEDESSEEDDDDEDAGGDAKQAAPKAPGGEGVTTSGEAKVVEVGVTRPAPASPEQASDAPPAKRQRV